MAYFESLALFATALLALLSRPTCSAAGPAPSLVLRALSPTSSLRFESPAAHPRQLGAAGLRSALRLLAGLTFGAQTAGGCRAFDSSDKCIACTPGLFVNSGGKCEAVPTPISNCVTYSSATACYRCISGFAVNANQICSNYTSLPNCLSQRETSACEVCQSGYDLADGLCKVATELCAEWSDSKECSVCKRNYSLSANKTCSPVPANRTVANCASYKDSNGLAYCEGCEGSLILDEQNQLCVQRSQVSFEVDPDCRWTAVNTGQNCAMCRQGYKMQDGICVKNIEDPNEGCFFPDSKDPKKCQICFTGFRMMSNNSCLAQATPGNGSPQVDPASAARLSAVLLALLLVFLTY